MGAQVQPRRRVSVSALPCLAGAIPPQLYPQNHVGCGWELRDGERGAVRPPNILVLISYSSGSALPRSPSRRRASSATLWSSTERSRP